MLSGETIAVYCGNHTEHINTHSVGRMQSFSVLKQTVHIVTTDSVAGSPSSEPHSFLTYSNNSLLRTRQFTPVYRRARKVRDLWNISEYGNFLTAENCWFSAKTSTLKDHRLSAVRNSYSLHLEAAFFLRNLKTRQAVVTKDLAIR
jgi:hypothetical protein